MNTGENEMGLRKIIDLTRFISIIILIIHFYFYCYGAFEQWKLTYPITDRILLNMSHTGMFNHFVTGKLFALLFLAISVVGARGKKSEKINYRQVVAYLVSGFALYFISGLCLLLKDMEATSIACLYMATTGTGYLLILSGGTILSRIIKNRLGNEVFNKANETFPQEERLLTNRYSFNFPAVYNLKGKQRQSWINIINPRRAILLLGGPGSGKTAFWVDGMLKQASEKRYTQFVFDWKFPELTTSTYNYYLKNQHLYAKAPAFYCVNFSRPIHRLNPLYPSMMTDIVDAIDASKTILLSINKSWAAKSGDFFVESPINLLAAVIWFLKKYQNGTYCTLPHAIELLQLPTSRLFSVLNSETEIQTLMATFISLYLDDNMETLSSQLASVNIPLGRLSSPVVYYVLSGNDFTLDLNNRENPKIFCLGADPLRADALSPILSLIIDRMNKIVNIPGGEPLFLCYDEAAVLRTQSVMKAIAQGRSNDLVTLLALQDLSQLKQSYTREEAETLFNMTGNIISGQVSGETAKLLSERFPKTMQERESISINSNDTSISRNKQLETPIPPSTISTLSSGEFVGIVADDPLQPIELKAFHGKRVVDFEKVKTEKAAFESLPFEDFALDNKIISEIHLQIKEDALIIADDVIDAMLNDPTKEHLVIRK